MARHYTSRPQVVTNLPEFLKVAVVDKSYNTGIPITTAVRKLLALWVEGFIDLSPKAKVQISDYKPVLKGVRTPVVAPIVNFYEPMSNKAVTTNVLENLEAKSDNRAIAKEIVIGIDDRLRAAREADGRIRDYKRGASEGVVIRKRPTPNKDERLDSVSGHGGVANSNGGHPIEAGSGTEESQGGCTQGPAPISESRFK